MPRAVAWTEIERTLATVDRSTPRGCRDYAILTLIAYGGLRAGDVAALHLSDFDWRRDTLHVRRTKGKWSDELPLIPLLGEAVIAYLRRRPETTHQKVFLTDKAPLQPIRDVRISAMARHYLQRAGVNAAKLGSHTLRHSFAVELLRKGHSLKTIGEMLGHAHPQSTFLYTKAAVEDLRTVALGLEEVQP
jgi:integrase